MSSTMKILLAVLAALLLSLVVLSALGKSPVAIPGIDGVLASEDELLTPTPTTPTPRPTSTNPTSTNPTSTNPTSTNPTSTNPTNPTSTNPTNPTSPTSSTTPASSSSAVDPTRATTDGTNAGNSPEALRAAQDATKIMQQAKIKVSTTANLVPSIGGSGTMAALRTYRASVQSASLVIRLDAAAMQQWTGAGSKTQTTLVRSFVTRLARTYAKATRSVTIVDSSGSLLAVGDARSRAPAAVKLYG